MYPFFFVNPWVMIFWIFTSWLIGVLGKDKRFGFFGNFLISFLFSPVVGTIVLVASDHRMPMRRRKYKLKG